METAAEFTELTPRQLAEFDFEDTKRYMRENERRNNIGNIVGNEKTWTTTVKNWKTDIENLIKHNIDRKISEIDLPEHHPQEINFFP